MKKLNMKTDLLTIWLRVFRSKNIFKNGDKIIESQEEKNKKIVSTKAAVNILI